MPDQNFWNSGCMPTALRNVLSANASSFSVATVKLYVSFRLPVPFMIIIDASINNMASTPMVFQLNPDVDSLQSGETISHII